MGSWDDSLEINNDQCNHIISLPSWDHYNKTNINALELWPIISGLRVWYPDLKGNSVSIFTDNTQVYHMVRKGTSSNKTCMQWLREIFWICKIYQIRLVPYYQVGATMNKTTRSVNLGRVGKTGCTVVGDMLECALWVTPTAPNTVSG